MPNTNEVITQILSLKDKAVGHDKIPAFFLKEAKFVIAPYLTLFLSHIFTEGIIYPSSCKIARIAPIHKGGAKNDTNHYRPISILICFAKIIEKLVYRRFVKFFETHKIIYANQYGLRGKVSTMHAMLDEVTSSYENINENCFTGLAFVDLRKAFATVSHSTLLLKLRHCGIRGGA